PLWWYCQDAPVHHTNSEFAFPVLSAIVTCKPSRAKPSRTEHRNRMKPQFFWPGLAALAVLLTGAHGQIGGPNVNVFRLAGNQTEAAIVIEPTNPNHLFVAANTENPGIFAAYSTNAGATWFYTDPADGTIADGGDSFPLACCDSSLSAAC